MIIMSRIGLIIFLSICLEGFAQDPQSSLFHANPLYHNPAFTGSTAFTRFSASHRSQWISLGNFAAYNTQMASFDTYFEYPQVGIGGSIVNDSQGNGFRAINASLSGARSFGFKDEKNKRLHQFWFGIGANYKHNWINSEDLRFVYQYSSNGYDNSIPVITSINNDNNIFKDSEFRGNAGIIYSSRSSDNINEPAYVIGYALHNIGPGGFSNVKQTFHFSKTFPLTQAKSVDENTIGFTAFYRRYLKNQQFDFGVNWVYSRVMFGFWYRGMPFFNNKGILQSDAIYPMFGFQLDNLRFTFAYDIPVSSLKSSGSFEVSIGYILAKGFDFKTHTSDNRTKCTNYGYYWLF